MDDLFVNIASQIKTHLTNLHKDGYRYIQTAGEKIQPLNAKKGSFDNPIDSQNDNIFFQTELNENQETVPFNIDNTKNCSSCTLFPSKQEDIVYGYGSLTARLMFITETPEKENESEYVFLSGKSRVLLSNILRASGFDIKDVYLTYIIKCVTPCNRNPEADEVEKCKRILFHQIETIKPKVICSLGALATSFLLGTPDTISNLRGKVIEYRNCALIPTFHPAYLLRSPQMKKYVWNDMLLIKKILSN